MGQVTSFGYDALGQRTSQTRSRTLADGSTETLTTPLAYDALGRRTKTIHSDGSHTETSYDAVGRLMSERDEQG